MTLADTLVVMNGGLAEQIDTPMAIYDKPASTFVAGFIGSPAMNLMTARVADGGHGLTLAGGGSVKPRDTVLPEIGREILLGVRPEHMTVTSSRSTADLTLKVTAVEILGADVLAHGQPADATQAGGELIARLPGGTRVDVGDVLPMAINPGMAHLFDAGTGKRI